MFAACMDMGAASGAGRGGVTSISTSQLAWLVLLAAILNAVGAGHVWGAQPQPELGGTILRVRLKIIGNLETMHD